jgi:hypothetical protein
MDICHAHNLNLARTKTKRYGIKVSLPPEDTFTRLLGREWERFHWFSSADERDRTMREMASEHLYSRRGDRPTVRFTPVER